MRNRSLFSRLIAAFLAISLAAHAALTGFALVAVEGFYLSRTRAELEARARMLKSAVGNLIQSERFEDLDAFCKNAGAGGSRITAILADGRVVGDSHEDVRVVDNHAGRPEVAEALRGRIGHATRFSSTVQQRMLYTAIPLQREDGAADVLRVSFPLTDVRQRLRDIAMPMTLVGLGVALAAGLLILGIARRVSRPLEDMTRAVERFGRGSLDERLPVEGSSEMVRLAEAMNRMATELGREIDTVRRQRHERDVVLASMTEGIVALDTEERIISMNAAAAQLLSVDLGACMNRAIQASVRHIGLQDLVAGVMREGRARVSGDIAIQQGANERFVHVYATRLDNGEDRRMGALIVLHDMTRIRQLENLRRDFVANVSHELKTPITTIQGFVETLRDGAMREPENAARFLEIMAKNAARLSAIVDDLLSLSRVEQERERGAVAMAVGPIRAPLAGAIEACAPKAEAKSIRLAWHCEDGLHGRINGRLLEQAVVNLIDNAVKYSPEGATVRVEADGDDQAIRIRVRDEGIGIASEHLPRLFERFYRVDKGRSRELGGTGLGLAIVKHIVQAHGGRVDVRSAPDEGSQFTIVIPAV